MNSIDAYITTVISLLGVAYPILLQVISRLDEKYQSELVVELFNKEFTGKFFKYSLFCSLILTVVWSLKLEPYVRIDFLNSFIENSAEILLGISCIVLVFVFFLYVNKMLVYYSPNKFIPYLISKYKKKENSVEQFEALSDIFILSIKQQQRNISLTLSEFLYTAFKSIRDKSNDEPVEYPDSYYDLVYKSIEELVIQKDKRNLALEYRIVGGIWLLGELKSGAISEKTYKWIWRNLSLVVQYHHDDMLLFHWATADQYYSFNLEPIQKKLEQINGTFQVSNQNVVDKRKTERERFIEFHYALGALLNSMNRFECIRRMFIHTNSQPPKYELLPESMTQIFQFYFKIRDPYDRKYTWISSSYPFPNQSGIVHDSIVKKWIFSFLAVLFLRQYTIFPYLTTMRPLDYPQIPETQSEIKEWIDGLDFFKKLVSEHIVNLELMKILKFDFITKEWCVKENKPYPLDFIDEFKSKLEEKYKNNALTIKIFPEKEEQVKNSTKTILETTLSKYQVLNNPNTISGELNKWYINGQRILFGKDALSEHPESHYFEFDSFIAKAISESIKEGISYTFLNKRSKTYLLRQEDFFKGIDALKVSDQFVLICFGFNLNHFINTLKVPKLTESNYKNATLFSFGGSREVYNTVFVINRSDLPKIHTIELEEDVMVKYKLKKISETYNLFFSILDLNECDDEILKENRKDFTDDELRKSALINVMFTLEILWSKNIELIQLIQYSEFEQRGLPNSLDEIIPFNKKKD